jgi:hypothetical protein
MGHFPIESALEPDNSGIDKIHHFGVKYKVHDMDVCKKDLIEQPRKIQDKSEPLGWQPFFSGSR